MSELVDFLTALAAAGGNVPRVSGPNRWRARCTNPDHEDRNPSMDISAGADGRLLLICRSRGCTFDEMLAGLGAATRAPRAPRHADEDHWVPCGHRRVEEYRYVDELHTLLYGVTRCDRKDFAQWRPDNTRRHGRRWSLKDDAGNLAVRLVPYRLPQLLAAIADRRVVWVVEGERDVHACKSHGIVATCNSGGAGKWRPDFASLFVGADVVVCADKDEPGKRHAEQVVANLRDTVQSLEVVVARFGKDARDHFAAGGHAGNFINVVDVKPWTPDPELALVLAGPR